MKKLLLLFFTFHLSFFTVTAQSWLWGVEATPKSYGGFGDLSTDHSVTTDRSGNIYITGFFRDTIAFGSNTIYGTDGLYGEAFLAKYDLNGNALWARNSAAPTSVCSAMSNSVAVDGTGNICIGGSFTDTASFGTYTLRELSNGHNNNGECFLVKYDASGNVLWARQATQATNACIASIYSVAFDKVGNVYVTGWVTDTSTFGSATLCTYKGGTAFVAKYTTNGNVVWAKQAILLTPAGAAKGYSVTLDKNANVYVTGYFTDSVAFGATQLKGTAGTSAFLAKYDSAGNVLWARQSAPGNGGAYSVAVDGASGIYITGQFEQTITFGPYTLTRPGNFTGYNFDIFLTKYDIVGNVIWSKQGACADTTTGWEGYSLSCDTLAKGGGYIAIVGSEVGFPQPFDLNFATDTFKLSAFGSTASILLNFDSAGNGLCGNIFTEGMEDDGDGICVDNSGKYVYYAGDLFASALFATDTLKYGNDMPFVARWNPCGSAEGINETNSAKYSITLFPNPNNGKFTVQSSVISGQSTVEVYNMLGEMVYQETLRQAQGDYTIDLGTNPTGVYLCRVITETGELVSDGKFVIKK